MNKKFFPADAVWLCLKVWSVVKKFNTVLARLSDKIECMYVMILTVSKVEFVLNIVLTFCCFLLVNIVSNFDCFSLQLKWFASVGMLRNA